MCKGRHIPAATLDDIVLTNLKQRVSAPDRVADLLKSLEGAVKALTDPTLSQRLKARWTVAQGPPRFFLEM